MRHIVRSLGQAVLLIAACRALAAQTPRTTPAQTPQTGRTLQVRVLDAGNGRPLKHKTMSVLWFPDPRGHHIKLPKTDSRGNLTMHVPDDAAKVKLMVMTMRGKDYIDCEEDLEHVDVQQALSTGVALRNTCSTRTITAHPGEIIHWVKQGSFLDNS